MKSASTSLFWNHQTDDVAGLIGHTTKMSESADGLWVEIKLDLTDGVATKVYEKVLVGDLKHLSVGLIVCERDPRDRKVITQADCSK